MVLPLLNIMKIQLYTKVFVLHSRINIQLTPEQHELGTNPLYSWKSTYNLQSALHLCSSFVSVVPYAVIQPTKHCVVLGCKSVVNSTEFTILKCPHVYGPVLFKPMLFKGQLYNMCTNDMQLNIKILKNLNFSNYSIGRRGALKSRSWVDISKCACCRENGGSIFDSYKKGVFLQQVCIRTCPTFWLCLASPIWSDLVLAGGCRMGRKASWLIEGSWHGCF